MTTHNHISTGEEQRTEIKTSEIMFDINSQLAPGAQLGSDTLFSCLWNYVFNSILLNCT